MLTQAQMQTLKTDILADPVLAALPATYASAMTIAGTYAMTASPQYVVWKSNVSQDEIMQNGFDWTRVDNLAVGPARIWEWMFNNADRSINPSKANVRAGIEAVWKGTAADLAVRDAVYVHCKRNANRLEKVFATGSGTTVSPSVMTIEGSISVDEVQIVMGW